jgi:regulator of protease activity HflC (stomatin/prohibitin superfamily)
MANEYPNIAQFVSKMGVLGIIAIILVSLGAGCMATTVGAGEQGVKFSKFTGTDHSMTYGEGLNLHAPWANIEKYDVRVQETIEPIVALSSNGLSIKMDISIRYRPIASDLPALHTTYGRDYFRRMVQPALRSVAREVVGRFTPEELYSTKRSELQGQIEEGVRGTVEGEFIEIAAVLIRHVELPPQIRAAIENKLEEEQEAERYEFTIQKERLEAQRKEIEAMGEATYQRIITESLTPQFLRFKGIAATLELASSPNSKVVIVGSGDDGLPLILGGQ